MILAGDIGGTKTNLAYFALERERLTLRKVQSYSSKKHSSLLDIVQAFTQEHPEEIRCAAFGIAGPVIDGRCEATNLPWIVDSREIASLLKLPSVGLINDLEATAYGTLRLDGTDKFTLNAGVSQVHATIAVIAAGTGLGEGGLVWDGSRYRTLPSEGGHSDFAPRDDIEVELLRFLLNRYQRVSYERIVSGPGLFNLYEFFRARAQYPEPAWLRSEIESGDPSAAVSKAALAEKDEVSVRTLETFVSIYGAEAGNLALKLLSTGGVFVGGGIAPKILPCIQKGTFMNSFTNKGRLSGLMKSIPVSVVLNDKTALFGSAHYALMMNDVD